MPAMLQMFELYSLLGIDKFQFKVYNWNSSTIKLQLNQIDSLQTQKVLWLFYIFTELPMVLNIWYGRFKFEPERKYRNQFCP